MDALPLSSIPETSLFSVYVKSSYSVWKTSQKLRRVSAISHVGKTEVLPPDLVRSAQRCWDMRNDTPDGEGWGYPSGNQQAEMLRLKSMGTLDYKGVLQRDLHLGIKAKFAEGSLKGSKLEDLEVNVCQEYAARNEVLLGAMCTCFGDSLQGSAAGRKNPRAGSY